MHVAYIVAYISNKWFVHPLIKIAENILTAYIIDCKNIYHVVLKCA